MTSRAAVRVATQPASRFDPELLAREGHGAIEVDSPTEPPVLVVLAGPIKVWWADGQWDSPAHREYVRWRDAVRVACIEAGFLVYSPHRAWQGAWTEAAQRVNDAAIETAHVMIDLTPPGTRADGTAAEAAHAHAAGTPVYPLPPGTAADLERATADIAAIGRAAAS